MALYGIFSFLDGALYSMVSFVVRLIVIIANYNFFKTEVIEEMAEKVYVVLGVLVLFKIIISCVQYMINPDVFDDKDKGMAGILKKAALCMGMLVLVQPVFNFALAMQSTIVSTIPGLILGGDGNNFSLTENNSSTIKKELDGIGDMVAGSTIWTFVTVKENKVTGNSKNISGKTITNQGKVYNEQGQNINGTVNGFRESILLGCDGSIWALFSTDSCVFDYRVGISTAAGVFLLYVLASLCLDVGIRAIKLGILQILAPIPIGSYIVSKDKLNKFVKVAVQVYIDLFIRLGVIYFIIFFVRKVVSELDGNIVIANGNYTPDTLETAFIKVIIIVALFMFAKKAPNFICDVLGIESKGFGDMSDMFKPVWQRAGGAAGAFVNPTRNAVSNWRQAWKNNSDMVDNRGGKIRRAMQNARRVGNASRHAAGGAFKGTVDAFAGAAAGDDWKKMNERHRKASAASAKRSAEGYMKRTSNDVRQEVRDQRKQIEKDFAEQGIDINSFTRSARSKAQDVVKQRLSGLQGKRDYLNQKIAQGGTAAEMSMWQAELMKTTSDIQALSSKEGFESAVKTEMQSAIGSMISGVVTRKTAAIKDRMDSNSERMSIIQTELADATLSDNERRKKNAEYVKLMQENDQLATQITPDAIDKRTKDLTEEFAQQAKIKEQKLETADISSKTIARGKVDQFFGGEGFTGKGYLDTADLLKNNRSSLYTGEAMTKMRQNADILINDDGSPATFKAKFTMPSAGDVKISYSEMADLKRRFDNGSLSIADLQNKGFENGAMLQSAFEDIEKQAAEAYVTANMAAADPTVHSKIKLKGNVAANSTIVEGIKRMKASLASANIPKEEKDRLLAELSSNPGTFFKGASDLQERMRTRGSRISAYNSGKKDN